MSKRRIAALLLVTSLLTAACSGGRGKPDTAVNTSGGSAAGAVGGPNGQNGRPNGTPAAAGSLDVKAENALPGTAGWKDGVDSGDDHGIEGYADHVEVAAGEPVKLYVNTVAPRFTATAFRVGFYGGADGRQVWKSAAQPGRCSPRRASSPASTRSRPGGGLR